MLTRVQQKLVKNINPHMLRACELFLPFWGKFRPHIWICIVVILNTILHVAGINYSQKSSLDHMNSCLSIHSSIVLSEREKWGKIEMSQLSDVALCFRDLIYRFSFTITSNYKFTLRWCFAFTCTHMWYWHG